jgi:N6-adenosine-specific RNA methylase IME4
MSALAKYDAARAALAAAHRIDEVKDIADRAVAMALYARQARDGELIAKATEIRKRAERRLGELIEQERQAGKLAKGGQPHQHKRKSTGSRKDPVAPTLADQGITKSLADRARKAAAMPAAAFEQEVAQTVRVAVAATEGDREVIRAARGARQVVEKRARRQERELELAGKIMALPDKRYGVIAADPPWRFEVFNEDSGSDRAAGNHYPTMDLAAIKAVPIPAADDCALFMWATVPMLPAALEVMAAWGFNYKSLIVWDKGRDGTGYWVRGRVEILLIGTRGNVPAPVPGEQPPQLITALRGRHSEKPAIVAEIIERLYPNIPKIELFARTRRDGWGAWGNEVPSPAAANGNAVNVEASAAARKAAYAVEEAGMTADPQKDGIPLFLQVQNRSVPK